MSVSPLKVVVIDDDFMIAKLHAKFVDQNPDYSVVGIANHYAEALRVVKETEPDILLLDVYMPDSSGIDLLREIRALRIPCDVILITASKELKAVEEGFRFGIFDYLIKPFDLELLENSLTKYMKFKRKLDTSTQVSQGMVEDLKKLRSHSYAKPVSSGIDFRTLELIKKCLMLQHAPLSAEEMAKLAGLSRSTARTYLAYLVEQNLVEEELVYGSIGRPQRVFKLK